ncbi:MAG: hypothetical protein GY749_05410 [Desulfobacteraceae bacterium]|nr:hypothetical protein [Desulfobacteraceae bacterium]
MYAYLNTLKLLDDLRPKDRADVDYLLVFQKIMEFILMTLSDLNDHNGIRVMEKSIIPVSKRFKNFIKHGSGSIYDITLPPTGRENCLDE